MQFFPNIDGHFWVERDGKIIDPYFAHYDTVCKVQHCDKKKMKWLPADPMIQTVMIGIFHKILIKHFGERPMDEIYSEVAMWLEPVGLRPNCCFQNAIIEIVQNGGKLVFGSLGFKKRDSDDYWFEYGGADYTVAKFLQRK